MNNFLADGPLYVTGWMDSGPLTYFSVAPGPLALAALAVPLLMGLALRSRGLILVGGLVVFGSLFMMGLFFPLEFWGGLALLAFLLGGSVLGWRRGRSAVPPLLVGALVMALALAAGFPRSIVFQATACKSNLKNIATAVEMWRMDHDDALPTSLSELTPNYLKTLPTCQGMDYAHQSSVIWCTQKLHQQIEGSPPGYPRIDGDGVFLERP